MNPKPKYNLWEAINVALTLGAKALEEIRTLARTPGPAGKDGRDGADASPPYDDLKRWYEDDGRIEVTQYLRNGELWKEIRLKTTSQVYRGIFDTSRTYERGDVVTHGGNQWHCNAETRGQLQAGEKWTLNLKKGRDSREGK